MKEKWNDYLSTLNDRQRKVVIKALNIALELSPKAEIEMPYGVPGLKLNKKPLIAVAAHKNHFGVYPFSPTVVEALKPLLKNPDTDKGTIRFKYDNFPDHDFFIKLIELRSKEVA